jgi:hypothetical protein
MNLLMGEAGPEIVFNTAQAERLLDLITVRGWIEWWMWSWWL